MRRENLEQTDHPQVRHYGSGHHRAYDPNPDTVVIDTRIVFRILAGDEKVAADAFSRQPFLHVHGSSKWRSRFTGSRPADHLVFGEKRQGRATGTGESQGALGDQLQNRVDVVTDLVDLAANRFHPREQPASIGYGNSRVRLSGRRQFRGFFSLALW